MVTKGLASYSASALVVSWWAVLAADIPVHLPLIIFAGFCGGLSHWALVRGKFWPDGVSKIFLGTVAATFLGSLALPLLEPVLGQVNAEPVISHMAGSFVTGLWGPGLLQFLLDVLTARRKRVMGGSND